MENHHKDKRSIFKSRLHIPIAREYFHFFPQFTHKKVFSCEDENICRRIKNHIIATVRQWASTSTLLILTLSRMTLSKVSFSDILRNDFDTFGKKIDFDTFNNDTFESV